MEVTLEDIQIMCVRAEGGPEGAKQALDKLESRLPALKGRKFYGTFHAGEYRAWWRLGRRMTLQPEVWTCGSFLLVDTFARR